VSWLTLTPRGVAVVFLNVGVAQPNPTGPGADLHGPGDEVDGIPDSGAPASPIRRPVPSMKSIQF
jgi:hypothetical protein